jgi:hypothetical protein
MKLTRRKLAAALLAPAAAAQQQPPPADDLAAARARLKANADAIAKVEVPMSTEPAFSFKA